MNPAVLIASIYVFALAAFLGSQVISRVPPLPAHAAHSHRPPTPSPTHLADWLAGACRRWPLSTRFAHILGFVAVTAATINVVGGSRHHRSAMLKMFGKRLPKGKSAPVAK